MEKTYIITDEKFSDAKHLLIKHGDLYKDGSFKVKGVEGYYTKNEDKLNVVITSKPFFASWNMIEEKLDEFFG